MLGPDRTYIHDRVIAARRYTHASLRTFDLGEPGRDCKVYTPAYDRGLWPGTMPNRLNEPEVFYLYIDRDPGDEC